MKEAWEYNNRLLYGLVRRKEGIHWVFMRKIWHKDAKKSAKLRALLLVLKGYESEICTICGRAVEVVWWCEDNLLWEELTDYKNGGGVLCVRCFDDRASNKGIVLNWNPSVIQSRYNLNELVPIPDNPEVIKATLEIRNQHYEKVIKEVLKCEPIRATDREEDVLEPPWEVIARVRRERDTYKALVEIQEQG